MKKAAKIIMAYAFNVMQVERIQATIVEENHKSRRLLVNHLDFKMEGLMRQNKFFKNKMISSEMLSCIRSDFYPKNKDIELVYL